MHFRYDALTYIELKYHHINEFPANLLQLSRGKNMWVEINSTNIDLIRDILTYFNAHPYVIDDIRTLEQRMKISILRDDIYLLLSLIYLDETKHIIEQQKLNFYLTENTLITVQECRTPALFSMMKTRLAKKPIQSAKGRLKKMKIDYLFYCLLNAVIENYMVVLDSILHETECIEKELMCAMKSQGHVLTFETLKLMFHIKHDLLHLKIVCAPLKDIIIKLQKTRETLVPKRQRPALRQCRRRLKRRLRLVLGHNCGYSAPRAVSTIEEDDEYITDDGVSALNDYIYKYFKRLLDHTVQLNDTIDSYSDIITSLINFYIILNGDLINRTMKTLTVMSCIFMPLNFLSAISAMNFKFMKQLHLSYGYFAQLGLMSLIGLIMIICFKLKRIF